MVPLRLDLPEGRSPIVLAIGAHADDLEIGCGGTLYQIARRRPSTVVHWWVVTADPVREREAREAAQQLLGEICRLEIRISHFRDGFLPYDGPGVKEAFEQLKAQIQPDLIFTHCRQDRHQDHRTIGELTWNTWRDHLIVEYEVPKYDADLGSPNVYVALEREEVDAKLRVLRNSFGSQQAKPWYSEETFRGLMRIRGLECRAASGFAEAFYAPKVRAEL